MERGEIWHVDLDPIKGHEIAGKRPVLIISTAEFNRVAGMALICPITLGGNLSRDAGYAVPLTGAGTRTQGVAVVNHLRSVDLRARKAKRVEKVPDFIIEDVLGRIQTILD